MAGRQMNKHIKYYLFELFYNFTCKVYYLQYSKASSLRKTPQVHYNVENNWPSNMVKQNVFLYFKMQDLRFARWMAVHCNGKKHGLKESLFFIDRAAHFYNGVMCEPTIKDGRLELVYIEKLWKNSTVECKYVFCMRSKVWTHSTPFYWPHVISIFCTIYYVLYSCTFMLLSYKHSFWSLIECLQCCSVAYNLQALFLFGKWIVL